MKSEKLYLFDFDGTITKKDTLFDFLKYTQPNFYLGFVIFIPFFILVKLKIISASKTKEKFISFFLKGKSKNEIAQMSEFYFKNNKHIIREKALKYIESIQNIQEKYIVSASLDFWLEPFAKHFNFKLICTKSKFKNNLFTGSYNGKNCNNKEKLIRINKEIDISKYSEIYVFGDTKGDYEMLNLATHKHFKFFE